MIETVTNICFVLLGLAMLGAIVRIILGPTLADRILGLDTITVLAVGTIGVFTVRTGLSLYADIAIAVALVGFLSTAAFARYLLSRGADVIYAAAVLLVLGSLLSAIAVLGILRFPDVYTRLHAASKAGPLGAGLILLGVAFAAGDWAIAIRCVLGFLFLILTSPVSAHLLARAALRSGVDPDKRTSIQEYDINH